MSFFPIVIKEREKPNDLNQFINTIVVGSANQSLVCYFFPHWHPPEGVINRNNC